jgi:hypothetical protein
METCEIYITGVVYKNQSWIDNPDYLLEQAYDNLNEIKDFDFASLSLNMAQVYNVSLKQSNYDSMIMYLKKVRYKHQEFLCLSDVENLQVQIKKQLDYIDGFNFVSMELRTSKLYTDRDLGIIPVRRSLV